MQPYEIIGHTADIGIKVSGRVINELFENAAKGMFAVMFGEGKDFSCPDLSKNLPPAEIKKLEIKREVFRYEDLLVFWLSELLYMFNQQPVIYEKISVLELNNSSLTAELYFKKADCIKDIIQREIKAVTFYDLNIEEDEHGFTCKIIFDI